MCGAHGWHGCIVKQVVAALVTFAVFEISELQAQVLPVVQLTAHAIGTHSWPLARVKSLITQHSLGRITLHILGCAHDNMSCWERSGQAQGLCWCTLCFNQTFYCMGCCAVSLQPRLLHEVVSKGPATVSADASELHIAAAACKAVLLIPLEFGACTHHACAAF